MDFSGVTRMKAVAVPIAFVIGIVIAVSLVWQISRDGASGLRSGLGPTGALHSVLLTNNQVYYGALERAGPDYIVLTQVFYVQTSSDPKSGERANKLVERAVNDWHAPTRMIIPNDKIIFAEVVGPDSTVAKLIAEAKRGR